MLKHAILDKTKKYRYILERRWGSDATNVVNFILLNPSTADATLDDPTVRACIKFAQQWKFDGLFITNLFAFRATDPVEMRSCKNPHGNENDRYLKSIAEKSRMVVVAWGNHGTHCGRDMEVLKILKDIKKLFCLGTTISGSPRHPLYIKRTVRPQPFRVQPIFT
jgi:hypothetical protein